MQTQNTEKREVATLIPYKKEKQEFKFFLQRRDKDAKRLPDWFGFFGGGLNQGEQPHDGMLREIREELVFNAENAQMFNHYEFLTSINTVYTLEVGDNFESCIKVCEGQYGKFFTLNEAIAEPKVIETVKLILTQLSKRLNGML